LSAKQALIYLMRFSKSDPKAFDLKKHLPLFIQLATRPELVEGQSELFGHALAAIAHRTPRLYFHLIESIDSLSKATALKPSVCRPKKEKLDVLRAVSFSEYEISEAPKLMSLLQPIQGVLSESQKDELVKEGVNQAPSDSEDQGLGRGPEIDEAWRMIPAAERKKIPETILRKALTGTAKPILGSTFRFDKEGVTKIVVGSEQVKYSSFGGTVKEAAVFYATVADQFSIAPHVSELPIAGTKGIKDRVGLKKWILSQKNAEQLWNDAFDVTLTKEQLAWYKKLYSTPPWQLTEDTLDSPFVGFDEISFILTNAKKPEALYAKKPGKDKIPMFAPTKEHGRKAVTLLLTKTNGRSANDVTDTYEKVVWLIGKSGFELDKDFFDKIELPNARDEVETMIQTKPLEYKGSPAIALLKIGKALLSYTKEDVQCADLNATQTQNPHVSDVLNWLANYSDLSDPLFAVKTVRSVIEKFGTNLCAVDAHNVLRAVGRTARANPKAQFDLMHIARLWKNGKPWNSGSFSKVITLAATVGPRAGLSDELRLIEGMRYLMSLSEKDRSEDDEAFVLDSILGRPEGIAKIEEGKPMTYGELAAVPGRLAKLCRKQPHMSSEDQEPLNFYLAHLRGKLDKENRPQMSGVDYGATKDKKLRELFSDPLYADDLIAIEQGCAAVPPAPEKEKKKPLSVGKTTSVPASKPKKGGDFDPWAGTKKKKMK